jgi:hypothetical protein
MSDLLAAFARCTKAGSGWSAQCPGHEDNRNSLSIHRGEDGRWLLKCHAGCALDAILQAAHLAVADLFPSSNGDHRKNGGAPVSSQRIVATYDYHDAAGELRYQVVRTEPKHFRPRRPDGAGGWIWNLKGTERVLYRLRDLQGRPTIYVVEGEKDSERLWGLGVPATTNPFGAGKWSASYTQQLVAAGCRTVVILPDNDAAGAAHARTVARSCVDAGLRAHVIALSDLPPKGDVSDYLARHSLADLDALVHDAPLYRGDERVADPAPVFTLTTIEDFLAAPDPPEDWIVADRIPTGAVVLFAGAPKAGKSTCVRELAYDAATGEPWLGHRTTRGLVWALLFEDKESEVRRHFRRLGPCTPGALRLFVGQAPHDLLPRLQRLATSESPTLIVIDTLARALRLKDANDYTGVTLALAPWQQLARTTGATLLFVHHASVHQQREGLDAILGSTAFSASVDNVFVLRRIEGRRVLSSVQRIGPDLEPTILTRDEATGRLGFAGTKRLVEARELRDRIVEALADAGEPVRESWLHEQVDGRRADKVQALRILLSQRRVTRTGKGGRGEPFLYVLAESDSGSQIRPSREQKRTPREPAKPQKNSMGVLLFPDSTLLVPGPIVRSRELQVRGREEVQDPRSDSGSRDSEIRTNDATQNAVTASKHSADSGSQILAKTGAPRQICAEASPDKTGTPPEDDDDAAF